MKIDIPKPELWQTPGRLQYYNAEMAPFVPQEIKFKIRMPTRTVQSQPNSKYFDISTKLVQDYLDHHIKFNFLGET